MCCLHLQVMAEKTSSQIVVNYWNDLPSAVVSASTLDSFKRRLRSLPDW